MATSSSYQFIPRKLIKRKPNVSHDAHPPTAKLPVASILLPVADAAKINSQTLQKLPDEHIAIWVNLAMSHYAVWSDPDLRRVLDSGDEELGPNCERRLYQLYSAIVTRLITRYSPQVFAAQLSSPCISRRARACLRGTGGKSTTRPFAYCVRYSCAHFRTIQNGVVNRVQCQGKRTRRHWGIRNTTVERWQAGQSDARRLEGKDSILRMFHSHLSWRGLLMRWPGKDPPELPHHSSNSAIHTLPSLPPRPLA